MDDSTRIAKNIKKGLWQNIGPAISCSIGIAPNSLLGKIASDMQKPDGLIILRQETLKQDLSKLSLIDIPGIGFNMEKRLRRSGIGSISELWDISPKHARKIWGSVQGERFWYWLHGYDFDEPEDPKHRTMIGHSRMLDPHLRNAPQTRQMARRLLMKASQRLRRQQYYASVLSLGVRTTDYYERNTITQRGIKWHQDISLPSPAQDPFTFFQHLDTLWHRMVYDLSCEKIPLRFKKVSVLLLSLRTKDQITEDLFVSGHPNLKQQNIKNTALTSALDKLQHKYQSEMVTLGAPPKTLAGYVGTKIAFSRVPDKEEFWN